MDHFTPPDAIQLSGNINENWAKWKEELDCYTLATDSEEKTERLKGTPTQI